MFTLEQVNREIDLFAKEMNISVPHLTSIVHEDNHHSYARVSLKDITNDKYIIYISNDLYQYDLNYQVSVLWHEFVHIHDMLYFKDNKNIKYIMTTCSEAFATTTQLEYLCRSGNPQHILHEGKLTTVSAVAQEYFSISVRYCRDTLATANPNSFYDAIVNFSYCCGAMLLCWEDPLLFLKSVIHHYPVIFQPALLLLGNAIFLNNPILAGDIYKRLHQIQQKQAAEMIQNNITQINNEIQEPR